jgi:hypothetical protein
MVDRERRTHARVNLQRPCKLYLPHVGKYAAGSTWNLSTGGVLLQLGVPAGVAPGDRLYVGIALKRRQAVLAATEMIEAEVIRVDRATEDRVDVAARFIEDMADDLSLISSAA